MIKMLIKLENINKKWFLISFKYTIFLSLHQHLYFIILKVHNYAKI